MRLKLLVIVLAAFVALVVGIDVAVRSWAQGQLESIAHDEIEENGGGSGPTKAKLGSFPFVLPLAFSGEVSQAKVRQENVPAGPVILSAVTVDLRDVKIDRGKLLSQQEVELVDIGSGTVEVELTDDEVSRVTRVPVAFADGRATARVAGVEVPVGVTVQRNELLLRPGDLPAVRIPFTGVPLVPCVAEVEIGDGVAVMRCTLDDVPPELVRAANEAGVR